MAINASPTFGGYTNISESVAAGATTSSGYSAPAIIGTVNGDTLTIGTGAPKAVNVKIDAQVTLAGSGTTTIDLTSFAGPGGTKTLAKVRGFHVKGLTANDTASASLTVAAGATNGQTLGTWLNTTGAPLTPGSEILLSNLSTAGWTVDSTHKNITFTAGSAGCSFTLCIWGE